MTDGLTPLNVSRFLLQDPDPTSDAAIFRQQMATSTDPRRMECEALRAELAEAKRHIETLTAFYMDNIAWTRACEEARAFGRSITRVANDGTVESITECAFTGVSG